ncbi:2,3-bisphosphoglycerate-independent phosphoglycerate mutase [Halioglobus pacificus]|uniref:2,3-bisphosphoglycerate-independent phosphoglycerate mutase n=1 Tax=Parahalioglobus pacificus TaxID=930806 RepID=A0A919CKI5_9GAMM|nr:2,3-bisphosphoglycerate-independent phosphoglycerate mutase [Halioglobus pacificus]NQY01797.1 2,3-bisphosphoglycerate-independent phosphoglycerate mutase [Halieaceae bacterium]GHD34213.1 2,3-bisphosphoglycerate-independent phosphoglycerate mutase [Halioglobus pacificus]
MSVADKKTTVLIVLDGWGYREESRDNAIANGKTPVWDRLWRDNPHTLVSGSGLDVGLPEGQMGNSEVGHMSLGAGRVIYQNITRIDQAIADGSFDENPAYTQAIDAAVLANGAVHVMGLLSPGGVHSHEDQIFAAIKLAAKRGAQRVYLHAFLDGRDTPPRSAMASLEKAGDLFAQLQCGRVASITGRYFAMDRDNRWDRIEQAYSLLTEGSAPHRSGNAIAALDAAYARDENDEFVLPTVIAAEGESPATINDGDTVLFMNFRADRARQLTHAMVDEAFTGFTRNKVPALSGFVMTTEYAGDIQAPCAFPPESLTNVLGDYIAQRGMTQLRIAETEKYAHVTFFFSGGREDEFAGENRIMIPSPDVATYDLKPEMSAPELTDQLVEAIESGQYDLVVCNYANGDMVGHTGVYEAAVKAVEALDTCLGRVEQAVLNSGAQALITADHGNCEQMIDYESGQHHTQHTTEHVPLVYVGNDAVTLDARGGILADIAPSLLALMHLEQPPEMTGNSLVSLAD